MRRVCLAVCCLTAALEVRAQTVPANFSVEDVAVAFTHPVDLEFGPDGRMWVAEQGGRVWLERDGARRLFLDLTAAVNGVGDRGLLGFAAHPNYASNGYVYALFTVDPDEREPNEAPETHTYARLERWAADPATDVVAPGSRVVLVGAAPSAGFPACHSSHTIGTVRFGADGMLYAGSGDGAHFDFIDVGGRDANCFATGNDRPGFPAAHDVGALRSQHLGSLSGKIVRIDPLTGRGLPDNPYWNGNPDAARSKVWVLGLRNPYRFAVRPGDGRLYIGDVGLGTWEELDVAAGGENFGWPCYEGDGVHAGYRAAAPARCDRLIVSGQNPFDPSVPGNYRRPSVSMRHPDSNAVSGTAFYVGGDYPREYMGRLFQADVIHDWIRMFQIGADGQPNAQFAPFLTNGAEPVDIEAHPETGDLHFISMARGAPDAGRVRRIRYRFSNAPPVPDLQAAPTEGQAPLTVAFDASASSDPEGDPLTFFWDFGDGSTSTEAAPEHTYVVGGSFLATVVVSDDRNGSSSADVLVEVGELPAEEPFFAPGTQPRQLQVPFEATSGCMECHAGYEPTPLAAPGDTWSGSMMANSARDPLFLAALTIANQTVEDGGSLCLRCHAPVGWLGGRSMPADGSGLLPEDRQGVTCAFCHRLDEGANRVPPGPLVGNGQFYLHDDDVYRGPRADAQSRHGSVRSDFFEDSALCAACHSVSSPVNEHLAADGQPLGGPMPEQRTYEEWAASAFPDDGITCQDCHMPPVAGRAAGDAVAPDRPDVARHDFAGGNAWGPLLLDAAYPGERPAAYAHTRQRALEMLRDAAEVTLRGVPAAVPPGVAIPLTVRVENLTGHKLPTGYPDGRRMWLEVSARVGAAAPYFVSGAYDAAEARLPADPQLRQYRAVLGIAGVGPTHDFLANDTVVEDTRIPPRGFVSDAPGLVPVGRAYADRHWDDAAYTLPPPPAGAAEVVVTARLLYQSTTREYVEFLRDENVTDGAGDRLYDLWQATGRAAPVEMASVSATVPVDAAESTVTLPAVADATVSAISWTWVPESRGNFGGAPTLLLYDVGERQALVRFDTSPIPAGARVSSATLRLYTQSINFANTPGVDVFPLTESWVEGSCASQYGCAPDGVTWTSRGPGLPDWTRPGGAFGARAGNAALAAGAFVQVDVTAALGSADVGFLLRGTRPYANEVAFASSEAADPARRPAVIVRYSLGDAPPDPCDGPGPYPAEVCDGDDDDCDGRTDEGFALGQACAAGVGECRRAGTTTCAGCDAVPGAPSVELCDGVDQDCDGEADEDFPLGQVCAAGVGECRRAGTVDCAGCDAVPGAPSAEVRNGLDDDCDGAVDEDTAPPGTLVLQRGVSGWADATVSGVDWTWVPETAGNFGGDTLLESYDIGVRQFLVRFDLAQLPPGAVVQSARLFLYVDGVDYPSNPFLQVFRLAESWTEGTCATQYGCAADGATWFDRGPGLGAWSEPGGTFAEMVAAAPLVPGDFATFDVTDVVRAWASGTPNHGLVARGTVRWSNEVRVCSAEHPDPALRPFVEVEYTLP